MPNFEFTTINRGRLGGTNFPENVLRVSKNAMSLSASIGEHLHSSRYTTENGDTNIKLALAFDIRNQAIQVRTADDGFSFKISESGHIVGRLPSEMLRAGMPTGDYRLVEGSTNIFQLAR